VPAKTDPQVVAKLNAAIDAVVKDPEVQQRLATLGFDPVTGASARAEALFKTEVEKWGKMVSAVGITVD
jgi:tripartite-type tricarboxylate transporter receptor subunit TctC